MVNATRKNGSKTETSEGENRLPKVPQSEEAEQAVCGAALMNPESITRVKLPVEDFYYIRNGYVWAAIQEAALLLGPDRDPWQTVNNITVAAVLRSKGLLAEVGGEAYLTLLINNTASSMTIEVYAELIKRAARRRRLLLAADEIKGLALNEDMDVDQVEAQALDLAAKAAEGHIRRGIRTMEEVVIDYYDLVERRMGGEEPTGYATGFDKLDADTGGFQKGEVILLAARPGMGKSGWLATAGFNMSGRFGLKGFVASKEMSDIQWVERMFAADSGIPSRKMRDGHLKTPLGADDGFKVFGTTADKLSRFPMVFNDDGDLTIEDLEQQVRFLIKTWGLDYVLVDYAQLIETRMKFGSNNRTQELSYITRRLKKIARLGVILIAAAQVGRGAEERPDKRPGLIDLRESGTLEQDADRVGFLYRPGYYSDRYPAWVTEMYWPKMRGDVSGFYRYYLYYDAPRTFFRELNSKDREELDKLFPKPKDKV